MASMSGSEQVQVQQQHGSDAGESTALLSKRGAGGGGGTARLLVHSNGSNSSSSDPFRDSKSGHGGSLSTSGRHKRMFEMHSSARKTIDMLWIVFGASLVALVSGTPNAFNTISHKLQEATASSNTFISVLTGIGVAGLQMSLPAGVLADNFGTHVACLAGAIAVVLGYVAMSFVTSEFLLVLCYILVGVGSGCTYLSALQTAINLGYSVGIALVSLCMSLSLTFTVLVTNVYAQAEDCFDNVCWASYVRVYGAVCAFFMLVGVLGLYTARKYSYGHANEDAPARPRAISLDMELTLLQSLRIFRKPFFLACFFANLVGVGSAVFIIASARQLWRNFDPNEATKDRNQTILVLFSIFTGVGNVAAPIITDALHKRGIARRSRQLAGILLYHGLVFAILALLTIVPALRSGGEGWKVLYQVAMASTGLGFGSCLSVFPAVLADVYGFRNFGAYMSFLQFGVAAIDIVAPAIGTAVWEATSYYSPMHVAFAVLNTVAAICMACVPSHSQSFDMPRQISRRTSTLQVGSGTRAVSPPVESELGGGSGGATSGNYHAALDTDAPPQTRRSS